MITYKGQVMQEVKDGLVQGLFPIRTEKLEEVTVLPSPKFLGKRMPVLLWGQVIAFFRAVFKKHASEAVVRLFYNETTQAWSIGVAAQTATGASVTETETVAGDGFEIGTIHSHARMSAFQSGTDKSDEKAGLHITVGKFDEPQIDTHARFVRAGVTYDVDLADWIEFPDFNVPAGLKVQLSPIIAKWVLTHADEKVEFPKEWLDKISEHSYNTSLTNWKNPSVGDWQTGYHYIPKLDETDTTHLWAAYDCLDKGLTARYPNHLREVQDLMETTENFILGIEKADEDDMAKRLEETAEEDAKRLGVYRDGTEGY